MQCGCGTLLVTLLPQLQLQRWLHESRDGGMSIRWLSGSGAAYRHPSAFVRILAIERIKQHGTCEILRDIIKWTWKKWMNESAVVQFKLRQCLVGHALATHNCCVDHEYSTNYPFLYLHKEWSLVPLPSDVWNKVFFKGPQAPAYKFFTCVLFGVWLYQKLPVISRHDSFFNSKHDVNFLRDLSSLTIYYFPTRGGFKCYYRAIT